MHKFIFYLRTTLLLLALIISSCLSQDDIGSFSTDELNLLLASDSLKLWNLTDRRINGETVIMDCERDDFMALGRATTTLDTATIVFSAGTIQCPGQIDSIIFSGYWSVPDTTNAQVLELVIDGDSSMVSIDFISSQLLQLSHNHGGEQIQEDYTTF